MNARDTLTALRQNKATKILAYALAALTLLAIGTLWSPQSQKVNDFTNCMHSAKQLHVDDAKCLPLARKL